MTDSSSWKELSVALSCITITFLGFICIGVYENTQLAENRYKRDKSHQELTVRKLEAEAKIAELRVKELELAQSFTTRWGETYTVKDKK